LGSLAQFVKAFSWIDLPDQTLWDSNGVFGPSRHAVGGYETAARTKLKENDPGYPSRLPDGRRLVSCRVLATDNPLTPYGRAGFPKLADHVQVRKHKDGEVYPAAADIDVKVLEQLFERPV
jgi:hypothetical protein